MAKKPIPTPEELRQLLRYEPETGKLFWLERPREFFTSDRSRVAWNSRFSGKEAFTVVGSRGYRRGAILGRPYKAHRIGWLLHFGEWPVGLIDHIDGNEGNNRIENLREASKATNGQNARMKRNNTSGFTGVGLHKRSGKWTAFVCVNGKQEFLGHFDDKADAIQSRKEAVTRYGFSERHGL